jgi:Raf kinase inhibitor-like YbhB/YbcL family protein
MMRLLMTVVALVPLAACGRAQPLAAEAAVKPLAIDRLAAPAGAAMVVRTSAIVSGGWLPLEQSAYGANQSPPLAWTAVAGAGAYAVVVEDPDAPGDAPFAHWLIWNIPGGVTSLPAGLPAQPGALPGAAQGRNGAGQAGYFGPRPPSGTHHYHIETFALDHPLALAPGADLTALEGAMRGHVVGQGELVALYKAPWG